MVISLSLLLLSILPIQKKKKRKQYFQNKYYYHINIQGMWPHQIKKKLITIKNINNILPWYLKNTSTLS